VPEEPLELDEALLLDEGSKALDDDGSTPELDNVALELLESGALDDSSEEELDELLAGGPLLDDELLSSPELDDELLEEELLLELDELLELLGALLLDDKLLELLLGALLLDDDESSLDDGSPLDELSPEEEEPLELEELDELLLRLEEELLDEGHGGHSSGSSQQQPMNAFRCHAPRVVCPVRRLIVTVR
jgi:hypothetical protein